MAALVLAGIVALALPASAEGPHADPGAAATDRADRVARLVASGELEYRDPRTGRTVVATPARVAALRNELAPMFEVAGVFDQAASADGTVRVDVDDRIRDVHVLRVNLDGSVEVACLRSLDDAVAFVIGADRALDGAPRPDRAAVAE